MRRKQLLQKVRHKKSAICLNTDRGSRASNLKKKRLLLIVIKKKSVMYIRRWGIATNKIARSKILKKNNCSKSKQKYLELRWRQTYSKTTHVEPKSSSDKLIVSQLPQIQTVFGNSNYVWQFPLPYIGRKVLFEI